VSSPRLPESLTADAAREFVRLIEIMAALRAPDGCPWDREQTHASLVQYLVEETHELVEAIALGDITVAASGHGPVVVSEDIARAARALSASPLVLIDLSASGDIALSLDEEADVLVVRLDDVHQQDAAADRADACVRREARALHPRIESSAVDDLIVAVRRHVEEVAAAEIGSSADPALAEAVRRVTQALLHEPTQRARRAAAEGELERYRAALETVLGVSTSTEAAPRVTAGSAA